MNNPADRPTPPPVELSQADELALDALLSEAFAAPGRQRDFTADILPRLHQHQQSVGLRSRASEPPPRRGSGSRWTLAAAAVAVLAASLLGVLFSSGQLDRVIRLVQQGKAVQPDIDSASPPVSQRDALAAALAQQPAAAESVLPRRKPAAPGGAQAEPSQPWPEYATTVAEPKTPRKAPLVLSAGVPQSDATVQQLQPNTAPPRAPSGADVAVDRSPSESPAENVELDDFNQRFTTYWKAIGVNPAPPISQSQWLSRIAARFGRQPAGASEDAMVAQAFTDAEACRALAQRLVDQLLVGLRPSEPRREQLIQEATEVILSGGRFDHWLSGWVSDEAGLKAPADARAGDPAALGEWVASRVLGADVGCAKCHDSPIDSRYVQHDFWAMAALFAPPERPLFYELADGRQKLAAPGVPTRWLGLPSSGERAARLAAPAELAAQLIDSPQVARALANHLWTIGFGTPLVAAASSPLAPPRDEALDQALAMLAERLRNEDFDIRAVARWVIASEPMKRGVPEHLVGDRWQLADESQLAAASLAQRSFAAAKTPLPKANRRQLLAMMQSRGRLSPATLTAPDALLAQPLTRAPEQAGRPTGAGRERSPGSARSGGAPTPASDPQDYWWTQWLADREGLRGGWLESIADPDQQLRHAFYAAGNRSVAAGQLQAAEVLLAAAQQDRSETIAQIHWILQNAN